MAVALIDNVVPAVTLLPDPTDSDPPLDCNCSAVPLNTPAFARFRSPSVTMLTAPLAVPFAALNSDAPWEPTVNVFARKLNAAPPFHVVPLMLVAPEVVRLSAFDAYRVSEVEPVSVRLTPVSVALCCALRVAAPSAMPPLPAVSD